MTPTPYYADDTVTVHHGDCLDVLATLPDASVDAVVTDPPYGLEFMGKNGTSSATGDEPRHVNRGIAPASQRHRDRQCGERLQFSNPAIRDEYDSSRGAFPAVVRALGRRMSPRPAPGGHLLAFGGTRTSHRLTCAIEDAGFEIRDSIAWLYGSGFPKSLDVSKAIDKAAGAEREVSSGLGWHRSTRRRV
jgi:DNA modification methylase